RDRKPLFDLPTLGCGPKIGATDRRELAKTRSATFNRSARTVMRAFLVALPLFTSPVFAQAPISPRPATPQRVLPGVEQSGAIRLHNQWSLRPAGRQVEVGDFPVALALHPSGKYLAVLHAGMGDHEIWVLDLQANRNKPVCRVQLDQTFGGLAFTPDGKRLLA